MHDAHCLHLAVRAATNVTVKSPVCNHTADQAVPEGRMLSSKVMAHGGASGVLPETCTTRMSR